MGRRLAGIVTLLVGLLAVAVLPALSGRGIVGIAQRVSAPLVGDCVSVDPPPSDPGDIRTASARTVLRPTARLANCADPNVARVIGRWQGPLLSATTSWRLYADKRTGLCDDKVAAARGRVSGAGYVWQRHDVRIGVRLRVQLGAELAVAPVQPAGRQWTICWASGNRGRPLPTLESGAPIDALGICFRVVGTVSLPAATPSASASASTSASTSPTMDIGPDDAPQDGGQPVDCSTPHTSQLLGTAALIAGLPTLTDYRSACRDFAALALGVTDPTAGSALRVETMDRHSDTGTPGDCRISVVDGDRMLSGSLLGLGSRPLPWAG